MKKSLKFIMAVALSLGAFIGTVSGTVKTSADSILSSSPKSIQGTWTGKATFEGKTKFVIKSHSFTQTMQGTITYYKTTVRSWHTKKVHGIWKSWFPFQVGIKGSYYHIGAPIDSSDDVEFVKPMTRHHKRVLKVYDNPVGTSTRYYYYLHKGK